MTDKGIVMANKEWLTVDAPDKWMKGWDAYNKKLLESDDERLNELMFIHPAVQALGGTLLRMEKELEALDLACGAGKTTCFLAKMGCKVHAIDALESSVAITQRRAEVLQVAAKVTVEQKNIDGWELPPESYDIIVATQCLQYLFDRAIPRLREIAAAIRPGGFVIYSGNIPPHFKTDPPMKFIFEKDLKEIFDGWTFYSLGRDERLMRPDDLRGYLWLVAQKPSPNDTKEKKNDS
jgi:2-polyprenyl-3-methyl-5-hydroxy-6-metoxy-1,4-benzoquinol methylase